MRPSLRQIEYFVAVAERGAFGAAAHSLGVTQPSLSKQLATMEDELGIQLFERTSRKVKLTPLGRKLLNRGRAILAEVREFRATARGSLGLFGDRLAIGVLPSVGAYFMPIANRRLHLRYPDLRLIVQEGATFELLGLLQEGRIDAVIGTRTNEPGINSISLFSETLWICAASDDPLSSGQGPVHLSDLAGQPLLSLSPEFRLAEIVERLAQLAGTFVSRDYQGGSLDAVRQMAVMGAGVAVLPSLYALAEAIRDPEFNIRRIEHEEAVHEIFLHWRASSVHADDFRQLANDLIEVKQQIRAARSERFR
ncbi:hyaluronan synthase [Roseibium aquae]|uniref:Hyaluronan synthase n=1 Tax=Roseibium aquae TaxID=1323746 RepID=A0A916T8S1_9HYPH|nr:LysR family transcriptional regulator [Roseibium aquae]GGB34482.1 hyaluronan synthase [Roseibium aquae]